MDAKISPIQLNPNYQSLPIDLGLYKKYRDKKKYYCTQ